MNINSSSTIPDVLHEEVTLQENPNYRKTSAPDTRIEFYSDTERYDMYLKELQDWVYTDDGSSTGGKIEASVIIQSSIDSGSQELILSELGLTTLPPLYALAHVQYLDFHHNRLQDIHSNAFSGLINLTYLNLTGNHIRVIQDYAFSGLPRLNKLNLSYNSIDMKSVYPNAFSDLPTLNTMDLSHNSIWSIKPIILLAISNPIGLLDLSSNRLIELEWSDHILCSKVDLRRNLLSAETRGVLHSHFSRTIFVD